MGACQSHRSLSPKSVDFQKGDYCQKLISVHTGQQVSSCSYAKWLHSIKDQCGFGDGTDFCNNRETHRKYGILVKPDGTNGRYITVRLKSFSQVVLSEKKTHDIKVIRLTHIPLFDIDESIGLCHPQPFGVKECCVIGYHDGLAVVQLNSEVTDSLPLFYILDLLEQRCVAHFSIAYHARMWYECYISPKKSRILLRPDHLTRILVLPDNYLIESLHIDSSVSLQVSAIQPSLRVKVLTFNSLAGENHIIVAGGRSVEIQSINSNIIMRGVHNLRLPAGIQQIRSSPSGDFIAVRCVHPIHAKEYKVNVIAVLDYTRLEILLSVDAKGCYWPFSEVINLQVFPRFSPSEACIAVMRNTSYKRQVCTYKLPVMHLNLQYLCRRVILHLVAVEDIHQLPLPLKLIEFLQCKSNIG